MEKRKEEVAMLSRSVAVHCTVAAIAFYIFINGTFFFFFLFVLGEAHFV